ncbi:MAG: hypothetical protein WA066_00930 [Candidatus Omnitrophota bacterium]
MDKEEALQDFFRSLKITFTTATFYSKGHPSFLKSLKDFKEKSDALLVFLNPIRIDVTVSSLVLDGLTYNKTGLHDELAAMFHKRKIKSIEIKQGVTLEEIVALTAGISLRPKEILRAGGISSVIKLGKNANLLVEELDYSQLLKGKGEEVKDIWACMLNQAIEKDDPSKIDELADSFEKIFEKFNVTDFTSDEQLSKNIGIFKKWLKENHKDKYSKFNKTMLKIILKEKEVSQADSLDQIKKFCHDMSTSQISDALYEEVLNNDDFHVSTFKFLSQFFGKIKNQEIASSLEKKLKETKDLKSKARVNKIIQELFLSDESLITEGSRHSLAALLETISLEDKYEFNRNFLHINYHFILLNLLAQENDPEVLKQIVESLIEEWGKISRDRDWLYLKNLLGTLKNSSKQNVSNADIFKVLEDKILLLAEDAIIANDAPEYLEYFIDMMETSARGGDFYLEKIFTENIIHQNILKIFLKLFPDRLTIFLKKLEPMRQEVEFMEEIIKNLKSTKLAAIYKIYKDIYSFSNEFIKIEVLKAMRDLAEYDAEFLFGILERENVYLKKEALFILIRDESVKKRVAGALLSIPNFFGIKNKVVLENLKLIEELGLKEATEHLVILSKKIFFWDWKVKTQAKVILRSWNV